MFCAVKREGLWPTLKSAQSGPEIPLPEPVAPISLSLLRLDPVRQRSWIGEIVSKGLAMQVWGPDLDP